MGVPIQNNRKKMSDDSGLSIVLPNFSKMHVLYDLLERINDARGLEWFFKYSHCSLTYSVAFFYHWELHHCFTTMLAFFLVEYTTHDEHALLTRGLSKCLHKMCLCCCTRKRFQTSRFQSPEIAM
jgi:hypothetical protein